MMDFKILFDKDSVDPGFRTGWGFSVFVDGILFDTGEDGPSLLNNLEKKEIAIGEIEAVVISHDHWDHIGGLWDILQLKKNLTIYGCPGFSKRFKDKVEELSGKFIAIEKPREIKNNIYTTGQIIGFYKSSEIAEQSLVVKSEKGLVVITGCSHPGIVKIIEKIKDIFSDEEIYLAFGGFHLMNKEIRQVKLIAQKLKNLGINYIGPTHCTGYEAQQIFKEIFKNKYISIKAGKTITV